MRLLVLVGLMLAVPSIGLAQFQTEVRPGARVRVWVPETDRQQEGPYRRQLLRGTVESVDGSLRLRIPGVAGTLAIPRNSVRRLDVSRGVSRGASAVERAIARCAPECLCLDRCRFAARQRRLGRATLRGQGHVQKPGT